MSEGSFDDDGLYSDADLVRMVRAMRGREEEPQWSVKLVRERLEKAARGCERIVPSVGPGGFSNGWPDWSLYGDTSAFDRQCMYEGVRDGTRLPDPIGRGAGSSVDIAMLERALYWPINYLSDPVHDANRRALKAWVYCCAKNKSFDALCESLKVPRRTAYRRVDRAAAVIMWGLIRDGVLP